MGSSRNMLTPHHLPQLPHQGFGWLNSTFSGTHPGASHGAQGLGLPLLLLLEPGVGEGRR